MNLTNHVSRRVVLQGVGAAVALPWLESSKLLAADRTSSDEKPSKRFAAIFFGDGIHPPEWWAKDSGSKMQLGPALASLEGVKEKLNVINGLGHGNNVLGGHAKGAAGILTGVTPKNGREIRGATSMDQLLARRLGDAMAIPSLVLACERPVSGFHESGNSMLYASHVSWRSPVAPVPAEMYPSLAFDSLFSAKGNRTHISVLDHVLEQLGDVSRKVSNSDRAKIDEYATSVREVEQRLKRLADAQLDQAGDAASLADKRPADGLPTALDEHCRLMCDIIALAFQTDRTRIATLLLTNNLSGQVYPFLGLRTDHHSYSHRWQHKEYAAVTRFWVENYAYLVGKLANMPEGDNTVLDNSCIMLINEQWTAHSSPKVPLVLAGNLNGAYETGRTLDFEQSKDRRLSSLYLNLMDGMGMELPKFGNSDERLAGF